MTKRCFTLRFWVIHQSWHAFNPHINILLKKRQNKQKKSLVLYYFKKGKFFPKGGAIGTNATPELRYCMLSFKLTCFKAKLYTKETNVRRCSSK